MAILDTLLFRSADPHAGGYLPQEELLRRVVARFPLAAIDRERGDQAVRDHLIWLTEVSAPPVNLNDWQSHTGQVAYVTVREEADGPQFEFFLLPNPGLIEIDFQPPEDRAACRPLLDALAVELEYDILTEDIEDPEDLEN